MALKVSARGQIPAFIVMDVMRRAEESERAGHAVWHLEVGQPGTSAPAGVLEAARQALEEERLGYTVAHGVPRLSRAIDDHYARTYGVDPDPAGIVVTTGSSAAFLLAFLAAFDPGDRVALAAPGYPCYRNILQALGLRPVLLETEIADRFQPTPELLEDAAGASGPLDGLIVASPSNPTGTMLSPERLASLVEWCRAHGTRVISDEIYHGITYGEPATTLLSLDDDAIVVNSFSKYYSMTGWRLGWMVVPPDLRRAVECLAQNFFISPPTLSQLAAAAAFDCVDELEANVRRYGENREVLMRELPRAGFDRLAPVDGAFYIYADVTSLTSDSVAYCRRILKETGVALTPGVDFDPLRGHRYVRFSFSESRATIEGAARALLAWRKSNPSERSQELGHPSGRRPPA
jgi:aspartate/methionine/tyrosine aminotransferase